MEKFYRAFTCHLNGHRQLFLTGDTYFSSTFDEIDKNPNDDFYESIYLYEQKHFDEYKVTKTLSGIKGIKTDRLVFDFDSHTNVEQARKDAVELVSRLYKININIHAIRLFYSGHKGFHVELHLNSYLSREEFEAIVFKFAEGLKTLDDKIKDEQRIFRYPLTRHAETNRYKIPLTVDQLSELSIEQIQKMSYLPEGSEDAVNLISSWVPIDLPQELKELTFEEPDVVYDYDGHDFDSKPDMSRKPKHLTSAKYALQEGYFEEGERNSAMMILASTYRFLGYNKDIAYNMLKATLRLRNQRLGLSEPSDMDRDEIWKTIIELVYSPHWKGGTYSEEENSLLQKVIKKYNLRDEYQEKSIVTVNEVAAKFLQFAQNIDTNRIRTGIEEIDNKVLITTGMMVGFLGAPSSGKTTHAITFLEHQSKNGIGAFFVSADMPDHLAYGRLLQRYCGWRLERILDTIKDTPIIQWDKQLKIAWDNVSENFKNVGFSFQSGPTIEEISNKISEHEQLTGNPVKVLVVDYLEKIRCNLSDATASSGYNAARLADLTRDKELATILLLQPQKSAGDPSDDLTSMRKIKGASVIEQDCRVILTNWRPGFNPDITGDNPDDQYCSITVVKNNMGTTGRMNFKWDGAYGTIRSLTNDEESDFKRVCNETKERKANKNDGLVF